MSVQQCGGLAAHPQWRNRGSRLQKRSRDSSGHLDFQVYRKSHLYSDAIFRRYINYIAIDSYEHPINVCSIPHNQHLTNEQGCQSLYLEKELFALDTETFSSLTMRRNTTNLSRFWSHHSSEGIHAASQVEVVRFLLKKTSLLCAQVLALVCFIAGVLFCAFSNFYMVLWSDFLLAADILGHSLWSFADCISLEITWQMQPHNTVMSFTKVLDYCSQPIICARVHLPWSRQTWATFYFIILALSLMSWWGCHMLTFWMLVYLPLLSHGLGPFAECMLGKFTR